MAEITKAEWLAVGDDVKQAQTQLQLLTDKADRLEKFQEEIKPNMWFVVGAKAIVTMFAVVVIGGIVSGAFWLGSLGADVRHLEKLSDEHRQAIEKLNERGTKVYGEFAPPVQEGTIVEVTGDTITIEESDGSRSKFKLTAVKRITLNGKHTKVTALKSGMEASVTARDETALQVAASIVQEGTIVKITADTITVELTEQKKQVNFKLTPRTRVTVDDKKAKRTALKVGMEVRVLVAPDDRTIAEAVEAWGIDE